MPENEIKEFEKDCNDYFEMMETEVRNFCVDNALYPWEVSITPRLTEDKKGIEIKFSYVNLNE